MDNYTKQRVREIFGTPFLNYCLDNKIVLTKNQHGAFLVPEHNALKNCLNHLNKLRVIINANLRTIQGLRSTVSKPEDYYIQRLHKSHNKAHNKTNKEQKITFTDLSLEIYLRNTSSVLPSYSSIAIQTKCILNTAKNGNEIYDYIINRTMKNVIITNYEASTPAISSLLEQFQKKHRKFHYSSVLKHLTHKQKFDQNSKCTYQINIKQMKQFFELVFAKVVPLNIFGQLRNMKKIKKALFHLINLPRFKSLNLILYINKLNISSIKWLQNIINIETAWFILAKFVKWFFNGFLMKILHIYFHVTTVSSSNNERIYVVRSDWCKVHKKFIDQKLRSNTLQPDIKCENEWNPPIGIYKLYPKYSSARPILVPNVANNNVRNSDEEKHLYTLFKFLKQLYITEYGLSNFDDKWRSLVKYKYTTPNKKLYIVSCDAVNAFGSINQGQLYNIIRQLCDKLPDNLMLRYYLVKSKRGKESDITCYRQYICDSYLQLPFTPGTLYTRTNHVEPIKKDWLLQRIQKYIFHQKVHDNVEISGKFYVIGKGIVQGTMLSPILSDIYFDFVIRKEMSVFLRTGKIIKYVDDILFATKNEDSAKQFLELTAKGIPQYNIRFKKLKLQTNMTYENKVADYITYIGYKINCSTLELEPNLLSTNLHHLMSSSKKELDPLKVLKLKLTNLATLRLSKIILDNRVNTKRTIMTILKKVCLLLAKRACISIKILFNDVKSYVRKIKNVIRISNNRITRYILTVLIKFDENMDKLDTCRWNKKILYILWASYKTVFMNDKILKQYFMKIFKY